MAMVFCHLLSLINMQKSDSKTDVFYWLVLSLDVILCGLFFNKVSICTLQKFFSRFWFCLQSQLGSKFLEENSKNQDPEELSCPIKKKKDDRILNREEVEMVMGYLGLSCSEESEKIDESMDLDEVFGEKGPSLEEVKDAFDVFDESRDGFIDEHELQRILVKLGLKEGVDLENCRNMIRKFDDNQDGRMDFNEFVKFMEDILE